jgi:soluble lytic murein transglycosylase-like protein
MALGAVSLGYPSSARADIFMLTDADGVQNFTNVPNDSRYQLVLADPAPKAQVQAPVPASASGSGSAGARPDRRRGRERYALAVSHAATDTGLPESLLHAVIKTESNYNANAISSKGAVGLMQLMPETARRYGVQDARDPASNVLAGARYLKNLLARFDADLTLALAAYNAGPGAVVRSRRTVPPYAETRRYVPRVMELYRRDAGQSAVPIIRAEPG